MDLERLTSGGRRFVVPEAVDEPLRGDRRTPIDQQQCQQQSSHPTAGVEWSGGAAHRDRTEDADLVSIASLIVDVVIAGHLVPPPVKQFTTPVKVW
jgi:hypothetical protein